MSQNHAQTQINARFEHDNNTDVIRTIPEKNVQYVGQNEFSKQVLNSNFAGLEKKEAEKIESFYNKIISISNKKQTKDKAVSKYEIYQNLAKQKGADRLSDLSKLSKKLEFSFSQLKESKTSKQKQDNRSGDISNIKQTILTAFFVILFVGIIYAVFDSYMYTDTPKAEITPYSTEKENKPVRTHFIQPDIDRMMNEYTAKTGNKIFEWRRNKIYKAFISNNFTKFEARKKIKNIAEKKY